MRQVAENSDPECSPRNTTNIKSPRNQKGYHFLRMVNVESARTWPPHCCCDWAEGKLFSSFLKTICRTQNRDIPRAGRSGAGQGTAGQCRAGPGRARRVGTERGGVRRGTSGGTGRERGRAARSGSARGRPSILTPRATKTAPWIGRIFRSTDVLNLSNPKPGHTTGGSGRDGAWRSGGAVRGRTRRRRDGSPRRQPSLLPSVAS